MKTLLTLFFAATAATAFSQEINVPKNKEFEIRTHSKDIGTYKNEEEYVYALKSLGKNAEGNSLFEVKIVKVLIKDANVPGGVLLNTDSLKNTNFYSTAGLLPLAMLNQPFTITVSPKGKVLKVSERAEWLKKRGADWNLESRILEQTLANAGAAFEGGIQGLFFELPAQKLALGGEWKRNEKDVPLKVAGVKGTSVTMTSSVKDSLRTSLDKYVINTQTGLIESAVRTSKNIFDQSVNTGQPAGAHSNLTRTVKLSNPRARPLPDTAWMNMAVRLSYWSDYIKKGSQSDSAKVQELISSDKYKRFANDPYFLRARLDASQALEGKDTYLIYYGLLADVPNEAIKNSSSHLHNKLGESLRRYGAAEAYEVSKFAVKTASFDDWIQHSFAQGFLEYSNDDAENARRAVHYELAELFHNTKDSLYQKKTNPLYLWVKAKKDPGNAPLLLSTATSLADLNDEQMKGGNGSRYSLLVYNMLLGAKKEVEADKLLDITIGKMSKYATDSLNKDRYAEQNMLAAAYYFKYIQAETAGSTAAMTYLSKAAQYSPKTAKEKAHGSFYDRVFIKSKESYRQEFIDKLMSGGDEAEALKVFSEHISAEPDNLQEMQDLYVKKFPSKDFKEFFVNNIMSSWKPAPPFNVTTIVGKKHSLDSFKGKWLVMDFWGTWCGPCRSEMPVVNKFSEDVTAGKHEGVEFLSIACRDSEKAVNAYLADNKFSIPVAISEGNMERDYKITGYPSKILIAPNGRMMNVQFGKDWQKVLAQYSKMYAASFQ